MTSEGLWFAGDVILGIDQSSTNLIEANYMDYVIWLPTDSALREKSQAPGRSTARAAQDGQAVVANAPAGR